jgi:hypothetical protein
LLQGIALYPAIDEIGFFTYGKLGILPDCGGLLAPLVCCIIMSPGSFIDLPIWSWDGQKIFPWRSNRLA